MVLILPQMLFGLFPLIYLVHQVPVKRAERTDYQSEKKNGRLSLATLYTQGGIRGDKSDDDAGTHQSVCKGNQQACFGSHIQDTRNMGIRLTLVTTPFLVLSYKK
jgi:hypothetical protein